jgi:hypothetical protein
MAQHVHQHRPGAECREQNFGHGKDDEGAPGGSEFGAEERCEEPMPCKCIEDEPNHGHPRTGAGDLGEKPLQAGMLPLGIQSRDTGAR